MSTWKTPSLIKLAARALREFPYMNARAARFLQRIKQLIEEPYRLLG